MDPPLMKGFVFLWTLALYSSSFSGVFSSYLDSRDVANSSLYSTQFSNSCASHILLLREENERLKQELDLFKYKNTELQLYVNSLSGQCGSIRRCKSEDNYYADGDVWYPDPCTTCRCEIDKVNCYTSFHSPYCELQCNENTCLNGGACMGSLNRQSVQCSCPDGFSGPLCEQTITSCSPIQTNNHCNHSQSIWYFDSLSNQCKSTVSGNNHAGCSGEEFSPFTERLCDTEMKSLVDTGHRIQTVLYNQEERFLKTLPRTCLSSHDIPKTYVNQIWNVQPDYFKPQSNYQVQIPICEESILLKCPYYTFAPCRLSLCGNCSLTCHVNNQDIECKESDIVSGCGPPEKRWYFDFQNQECYSFMYHGCSGNGNNFPSYYECRITCKIGACCWRTPRFPGRVPGFNADGYDRFCFQLHHHSKCELNKPPVPCPFHTCSSQLCPTLPSAQCRNFGCGSCDANYFNVVTQKATTCNKNDCIAVDGNVKADGEVWEEELCYSCTCQGGNVHCNVINCPLLTCQYPARSNGECCRHCDGCQYDGKDYEDGSNGIVSCSDKESCPGQKCTHGVVPAGECCSPCIGCQVLGKIYQNNAEIPSSDACRKCYCYKDVIWEEEY
ncbi:Kielin/chordin-like protein like [Argiope bruennichi]|uniref:Kielin/chordin-like protein like n=1 Tax=Argiope bruennichi TaxID=94029 RepID=A0A8T0F392_ARGBR|nr:Kielin/chordin-like protein like [Argiope bruennichi]